MKTARQILITTIVYILVSISFLVPIQLNGQDQKALNLHGKLIDNETKQAIQHALCLLKNNEFIGDISDKEGYFHLTIPKNFQYDTLFISLMGYSDLELPLSEIELEKDTTSFYLRRKSILLDDIVVTDHGLKLQNIVAKAIRKIPKNYPNKKHQLTGFYRKLSTKENRYTHLEEASVIINDKKYSNTSSNVRMKVDQYRQSKELGEIDSIHLQYLHKLKEKWPHDGNPLDNIYVGNFKRYFDILSIDRVTTLPAEKYNFNLQDLYIQDGDTILQISYYVIPVAEVGMPVGEMWLKINTTDYAIIEKEYISKNSLSDYLYNKHITKNRKIGDRYYPYYLRTIRTRHINRDLFDGEYDITTFWLDELKVKSFEKILKEESIIKKFEWDSYQLIPYDSAFWQNYQMRKDHPLEQGARKDLEINTPLDQQFKLNQHEK